MQYEIEITTASLPQKELVANCKKCGRELKRVSWANYHDYRRKRGLLLRECGACSACVVLPQGNKVKTAIMSWVKVNPRTWKARGKYGEFIVYKDGNGWKGIYHTLNDSYFFFLSRCKKIEKIKANCEKNKYWEA